MRLFVRLVWSPSPRKAWIETRRMSCLIRNLKSPSPRKAWIETGELMQYVIAALVAFPPEGVD